VCKAASIPASLKLAFLCPQTNHSPREESFYKVQSSKIILSTLQDSIYIHVSVQQKEALKTEQLYTCKKIIVAEMSVSQKME